MAEKLKPTTSVVRIADCVQSHCLTQRLKSLGYFHPVRFADEDSLHFCAKPVCAISATSAFWCDE